MKLEMVYMMRIIFFSTRDDEIPFIENQNQQYGFDFKYIKEPLTPSNLDLTKNIPVISVSSAYPITEDMLVILKRNGVKHIATRATGHNHVSTELAKQYGIHLSYVPKYSPNSISEFTLLLALSIIRNFKPNIEKASKHDFTYSGLMGKQLKDMTVGVVGDGSIGFEVIKAFHGMGCQVITTSRHPKDYVLPFASYTTMNELIKQSDLITLHCPLTEETTHIINTASIEEMKNGVYIVNTARGGLIEHKAILAALNSGKLAGFAFDVYENESSFIRKNLQHKTINDKIFLSLLEHPHCVYAPHIAFLTDNAVSTIIKITLQNIFDYYHTGKSHNDLW